MPMWSKAKILEDGSTSYLNSILKEISWMMWHFLLEMTIAMNKSRNNKKWAILFKFFKSKVQRKKELKDRTQKRIPNRNKTLRNNLMSSLNKKAKNNHRNPHNKKRRNPSQKTTTKTKRAGETRESNTSAG